MLFTPLPGSSQEGGITCKKWAGLFLLEEGILQALLYPIIAVLVTSLSWGLAAHCARPMHITRQQLWDPALSWVLLT